MPNRLQDSSPNTTNLSFAFRPLQKPRHTVVDYCLYFDFHLLLRWQELGQITSSLFETIAADSLGLPIIL